MTFSPRNNSLYLYAQRTYAGRIAKRHQAPGYELVPSGSVAFNVAELEVIAAAIQRCDQLFSCGKAIDAVDWK